MNIEDILEVLMYVLIIFLSLALFYTGYNLELGIEETECYDKYSNEIIGETCLEETTESDKYINYFFGIWVLIILIPIRIMFNTGREMSRNGF